ncbi:MAG: amidase [Deltaproteobacteria bacterium]|nr:amidase [Deltaproteobacteria bacterium]
MSEGKKRISAFCDDALETLDGVGIAEKISAGEISASEAVEAAIARARSVNSELNAIVTEIFDMAREQAKKIVPGPFAGVPAFIKDTDDVKGAPTLWGSRAVPNKPIRKSKRFVEQFISLGLICLGKSTLPEFGLTATTEPLSSGITRNPWHTDYSTGGSSGGSAALVAAGVVPIAHGNDGGGSIRIPAACCGVVGLKPSRGRLEPVEGSSLMPVNILHQGIVTRTVRDTAAFYAGAEKYRRNPKLPEIGLVQYPGKKRLRIALFTDTPYGKPCHPESADLVRRVGSLCKELGHTVKEIPCPCDAQMAEDFILYWGLLAFSFRFFGQFLIAPGFDRSKLDSWTIDISRHFQKNFLKAPATIKRLQGYSKVYNEIFSTCDILLNPTLAHPTPEIGYIGPDVPFEEAFERVRQYVAFTPQQNVTGTPAISLPLGFSISGLPLGVQFGAAFGQEKELLELAFELEEARPWPRIGQ